MRMIYYRRTSEYQLPGFVSLYIFFTEVTFYYDASRKFSRFIGNPRGKLERASQMSQAKEPHERSSHDEQPT